MRALVTGGAGFIGSYLVEALCSREDRVMVLDNFSTGSKENLSAVAKEVEIVDGDICDRALIRRLVKGVDCVFHLAAHASVPYSVENPEETNRTNLNAVLSMLSECREAGTKRFVFSSSCSVYGSVPKPVEETDPVDPLSPYALQKYAAERYTQIFHALYQLPTVSLRYFNVFGPRQSYNSPYSGVIARFCDALLDGRPPVIFGTGEQSRDFVSVHDVVRANLLAAEGTRALGRVFNIGRGQSTSVFELLQILNRVNGSDIAPQFSPSRPGEILFSQANIAIARRALGFEPSAGLEEALNETLLFYRNQRKK